MFENHRFVIFSLTFLVLLYSGCANNIQVHETGIEETNTIAETIRMNNCGGKADAKQIAERSIAIEIKGAGRIGIQYGALQAAVSGRYGKSSITTKSQELTAPPGTNMEFTLAWLEEGYTGLITTEDKPNQATYRVRLPVSVELVSSRDLGCGGASQPPARQQLQPTRHVEQVPPSENQPQPAINKPSPTPSFRKLVIMGVTASTVHDPQDENGYWPSNAVDGNLSTIWASADEKEEAVGAWLELELPEPRTVVGVRVYTLGPGDYSARVKDAKLVFSDGPQQTISFNDAKGWQYGGISTTYTDRVRIVVDSVYPGTSNSGVVISEIELLGR